MKSYFEEIRLSSCIIAFFSSAMLAFGLYNIHSLSGVTEGGILGLTLLLEHWFGISPSISGMVLNLLCYLMGWKFLGRKFIIYSIAAATGFSISYRIFELFDPLFPQLAERPLAAAILGAVFVGVSAGICVRVGGAPGGDDALAMSIARVTHMDIRWVYLLCDLVVLVLSLSYIPVQRIAYSFLTVILSGQIIGIVQKMKFH
ncbi:MAG: YitT family protein [Oliverpabstia sp.]|nr:YitT family protein [Lachnospiraceae bacterium]MDY5025708.1 YitT family protein [Oliverpabstia sp.]